MATWVSSWMNWDCAMPMYEMKCNMLPCFIIICLVRSEVSLLMVWFVWTAPPARLNRSCGLMDPSRYLLSMDYISCGLMDPCRYLLSMDYNSCGPENN